MVKTFDALVALSTVFSGRVNPFFANSAPENFLLCDEATSIVALRGASTLHLLLKSQLVEYLHLLTGHVACVTFGHLVGKYNDG